MKTSFAVGQVWRYQTRSGEPNSVVTICKVEPFGESAVVHIGVSNLQLKNPHTSQGFQDTLPHLPIDESALRASVTELLEENGPLPDYEKGHANWKEAQGGVWTLSLAETIDTLESAIQPRKRWWQRFKRSA